MLAALGRAAIGWKPARVAGGQTAHALTRPHRAGAPAICCQLAGLKGRARGPQEDNFHLVDSRPTQRKQGGRRFQPNRFQQQRQQRDQRGEPPAHQDRQPRKQQQKRPQFFHRDNQRVRAPGGPRERGRAAGRCPRGGAAGAACGVSCRRAKWLRRTLEEGLLLHVVVVDAGRWVRLDARPGPHARCCDRARLAQTGHASRTHHRGARAAADRVRARGRAQQTVYTCSVDIRPEWAVVEQIPFASLAKLSTAAPAAEDLLFCGEAKHYDKAFDRVTPKEPRPLQRTKRVFRSVTTSEDPVIKRAPPSCPHPPPPPARPAPSALGNSLPGDAPLLSGRDGQAGR